MRKITRLAMITALGATLGLAIAGPVSAAAPEGVMKYAINKPSVSWNVYGPGQTNAPVKDKAVMGGSAVRVQVNTATPDKPWDSSAGQAVDGGPATATVSSVRVQQSAAPWGGVVEGKVETIGGAWKIYTISGRALIDAEKGGAGVALHLGSAKQTIVLGPLFVLDFGANYDPSMTAR